MLVMDFRPLSQCRSDLDFKPLRLWPSHLPVFSWESQRLCGFERPDVGAAVELDGPIEDILFQIHPKLSFVEVSSLFNCLQRAQMSFCSEKLFRNWGFAFGDSVQKSVLSTLSWPDEFLQFAKEKSLSQRDLEPIQLISDMNIELIQLSKTRASKSEAVQLIELIADLKMLGRLTELNWELEARVLIEELRFARYPKRTAKMIEARKKAKSLSWPRGMKWSWKTISDQNTLEMQLTAHSLQELGKLTRQLNKVVDQANLDKGSDPWR